MAATYLEAFPRQKALKHAAACERIIEIKGVHPAHERQIGR
jgi:hypothetical protein